MKRKLNALGLDEKEIAEWLQEAREAVQRQRHGFMDRGDGHTIIGTLESLLQILNVPRYMDLYRAWNHEEIRKT